MNKLSNQPGKCVVYVMQTKLTIIDNQVLYEAQQKAINLKVPLAVVYCVDEAQQPVALSTLCDIEANLTDLNIPFIVMFGDAKNCLAAFSFHTTPAALYFDTHTVPSRKEKTSLVRQDTNWPGIVKSLHELEDQVKAAQKQGLLS